MRSGVHVRTHACAAAVRAGGGGVHARACGRGHPPPTYTDHRRPPSLRSDSFYDDYTPGTPLHDWVVSDIAAIDYETTPWVVVTLHAPWYNSSE